MRTYRTARQVEAYLRGQAQRRGRSIRITSHTEHCALFDESGLYEPRCDCQPRRLYIRVAAPVRRR